MPLLCLIVKKKIKRDFYNHNDVHACIFHVVENIKQISNIVAVISGSCHIVFLFKSNNEHEETKSDKIFCRAVVTRRNGNWLKKITR